jgi:Uma2 family endonuclease
VESDHTHSSINKFEIYAALGVPELWRYHKDTLQVYQLSAGSYEISSKSLAFPGFPIAEIPEFINRSQDVSQRATVRLFRERVRAELGA